MSVTHTMHSRIKLSSMSKPVWRESRASSRQQFSTANTRTPADGPQSAARSQLPVLNSLKMADEAKPSPERSSFLEDENREPPHSQEFEGPNCRAETVVVYLDKAEVCRSLKTRVRQGESEILLKNVSPCIEKDSIRVEAKGKLTIVDVSLQTRHLASDEQESRQAYGSVNQIRNDLLRQNKFKSKLLAKQQRLRRQREVLDAYLDSLMKAEGNDEKGCSNHENLKSKLEASSSVLEGINTFFEMYNRQASRLDDLIDKNQVEIDDVQSKVEKNERALARMNAEEEEKEAKELLILIDAEESKEVEMYVTYVVSKAGWSPKYDIRVFSNDGTMKIVYYGIVQQSSGENWDDTKLCLSTAMPSIGGIVPELGTQTLAFKNRVASCDLPEKALRRGRFGGSRRNRKSVEIIPVPKTKENGEVVEGLIIAGGESMTSSIGSEDSATLLDMPIAENSPKLWPKENVKESITSTMYEIARRCSIACNNEEHKVSVALVDLKPTFEYECVPRKAAHAYLKAKVRNTSPYALLAGATNIFLDNNFVAKSELKAVSPQEDFTCSLGVDPGVRIVYRPLHKYREQSGLLTKAVLTTYKQLIEVKNTHNDPIRILITDHLPLSMEERIKVTLQDPVIKHPEKHDMSKPIRLNKYNNIEWELEVVPHEVKELVLKYTVESPMGEDIDCVINQMCNNSSVC